jgi:hypothetical protein
LQLSQNRLDLRREHNAQNVGSEAAHDGRPGFVSGPVAGEQVAGLPIADRKIARQPLVAVLAAVP